MLHKGAKKRRGAKTGWRIFAMIPVDGANLASEKITVTKQKTETVLLASKEIALDVNNETIRYVHTSHDTAVENL
jgi:hypothetical protein